MRRKIPTDVNALPRREREKEQHRREVLQIAEDLLKEKSYREITMQEIALAAEFSVGYLYKLFPNKESMFISLLRHKHESLVALIDKNLDAPGPFEERLTGVIQAIFAWINENMDYAASSLRDLHVLAHTEAGMTSDWFRYHEAIHHRFQVFFQEAVRDGFLAEDAPDLAARTLRAIIWGFIREDLLSGGGKRDWTEDAPRVVRIIMKAFSPEKSG